MKNQITSRATRTAEAATLCLMWSCAIATTLLLTFSQRARGAVDRRVRERGFTAIETALIVAGGLSIAALLVVVATKAYNTHAAGIK